MDDKNLSLLAALVGPCADCGNGKLRAVFDGEGTNFLCDGCGSCWHPELDWITRVNPSTCPGCANRGICTAPRRAYGTAPGPVVATAGQP